MRKELTDRGSVLTKLDLIVVVLLRWAWRGL